jgi:hypothetical protein
MKILPLGWGKKLGSGTTPTVQRRSTSQRGSRDASCQELFDVESSSVLRLARISHVALARSNQTWLQLLVNEENPCRCRQATTPDPIEATTVGARKGARDEGKSCTSMTTDRFVMPFGVTETSWATVFLSPKRMLSLKSIYFTLCMQPLKPRCVNTEIW